MSLEFVLVREQCSRANVQEQCSRAIVQEFIDHGPSTLEHSASLGSLLIIEFQPNES